jgi:predicted DNA-binding transcriptional regulator YafY
LSKLGSPDVPDLPPVAVLPSLPALAPLQEAVRRRSTARFHYRGREREVEPYGLCFRSGTWYIVGRDRTAGHWHEHHRGDHDRDHGAAGDDDHRRDVRTFRVDRIDGGVVATGEPATFEPPPDLDLAEMVRYVPWRSRGEEAIEVTVDVDPRELRSARNAGGRPRPKKNADGSTRHTFTVGDEGGFAAWAAGLGDGAVVVSPERIRKLVIDRLRLLAGEIDG